MMLTHSVQTRALEPYGKKAYQMKHKDEIEELQGETNLAFERRSIESDLSVVW
jgi:hypothetical protein